MNVPEAYHARERTVQKALDNPAEPARRKRAGSARSARVTRLKVDSRVWRVAVKLSRGDHTRLRVLSATEVVVTNPRTEAEPWPCAGWDSCPNPAHRHGG